MPDIVLIVLGAFLGWCVLSLVVALLVGRRLRAASTHLRRPQGALLVREQHRRPAA
jgi:hypothetical protein